MVTLARTVTVPADDPVLTFWNRYDIEEGYDYVQVLADGAQVDVWDGTQADWAQRTVDLSAYAGQTITLTFSYVTDPAVGGNDADLPDGVVLDDIALGGTVIGDAENGLGDWESTGWVTAGDAYSTSHPGTTSRRTAPMCPTTSTSGRGRTSSGTGRRSPTRWTTSPTSRDS